MQDILNSIQNQSTINWRCVGKIKVYSVSHSRTHSWKYEELDTLDIFTNLMKLLCKDQFLFIRMKSPQEWILSGFL